MGMAQENEVAVKVTADASPLKPGMDSAANDVEKASERMRASVAGLKDTIGGHMTQMTETVKAANDGIAGSFSSLTGAFSRVNVVLAGMAAVLAGGAVFKAGVEESKKLTGEANGLAKALGISTTEASALNVALGDIYSSSETFIGASQMLGRQLRTNEEGLNAMGLKTRDANGEYRNMKDLMMDGIKVLNGYKEGTDRNLAAQAMFGRGGAEVMSMLKLTNETIDAAKKKQEELGLVVGVENVEAAKAYKAAMNDVDDVMSAMRKAIGDAVMPVLTKLGEWFSTIGPAAVVTIKGAVGGLIATFWALKNGVVVLWETINAMVVSVTEPIRALSSAIFKAMTGDFAGAKAEISGIGNVISDAWSQSLDEMLKSSEETSEKIANLFNRPTDTAPKEATGKSFVDPNAKEKKSAAPKSLMPQWEADLAKLKAKYMIEHDMYEMSLEDEKKYWDAKLATLDKGDKEYGAVMKKSADMQLQILKKKAQEGRARAQEEVEEWKRAATNGIDIQQQAAEEALALGQINKAEKLQLDLQFEQERYEIARQALKQRMELLAKDPNMNPVEYQKLKNQLLEIYRKHALDKRKIESQITVEKMTPQMNVFKSMETSFSSAITGMLTRAQTFRQALGNIFKSIFSSFVTEMVAKPLIETASGLIRQTALYQTFFGVKAGLQATDLATKTAADAAAGASSVAKAAVAIPAEAGVAAAGAAASVAPTPFVGPALAAAAFAATMAMVMGALGGGSGGGSTTTGAGINMGKGSIPSAEGGWDIPAGATGLMKYHEREMMLPAEHADTIRSLKSGSAGGTVNLHVQTLDVAGVRDFFRKNSHTLAPGLRQMARNFTPSKA